MKIAFAKPALPKKGVLVVGVHEGKALLPTAAELDRISGGAVARAIAASRFTGKAHQTLSLLAPAGTELSQILLYGLGKPDAVDVALVEDAGGNIAAALAKAPEGEAVVAFDASEGAKGDLAERAAALGFGAMLRAYRFDKYRTREKAEDKPSLKKLTVQVAEPAAAKKRFEVLEGLAESVFLTRDVVSEPPNVIHPESLAEVCKGLTEVGLEVEVLGEKEMKKLGMGALLGVGQGSARESKMVVMQWKGLKGSDKPPVAFLGKGVCFDTGGISIKPAQGMEDMKWDMGGAGTVIGLMRALAARKAKVNAVGIVGLVENMPDGNAQRPSDVVTTMSGQTIEVINTDAEGRLVLADCLWYCQDRFKPRFMIDLATLTGAIVVALGSVYAGFYSTDDAIAGQLIAAGKAVREPVWRMPLDEAYDEQIKSDIADMKNTGGRWGGSITAAMLLKRFTNDVPWVHIDIAGMAWYDKDKPTVPKGASAFGVRLLDRFVAENCEG
ncbi:MAG: leucyl aminopeptidase [Thalassobaculales bacterium]